MPSFHIWRDDPPPRDAVIEMRFSLTNDQWLRVRTCKRGCCVHTDPDDGFGSMLNGKFWREVDDAKAS